MKKWEEERKKKQYNNKIRSTKAVLKTQPKGAKVATNRTPFRESHYYDDDVHPSESHYPSRG